MQIEIQYKNGNTFTVTIDEKNVQNVTACLLDDISVSVLHSMGKAEEAE